MENETTPEAIIEQEETNEETNKETTEETTVEEKKVEAPEAKKARLERQLKKVNKELGVEEKPKEEPKEEKEVVVETKESLSIKETIALGKVDPEDIDEVIEFAKYKKIDVIEALKNQTLKTILSDRVEERKTADATVTGSPRGTAKVSGEALIAKSAKGELPEDEKGIEALVDARMDAKLANINK